MQNLNSPKFPKNYAMRGFREPVTITAILVGAAIGAVTAAVTGGNILKGALMGAIGGAIGAAVAPAASAAAGAGEVALTTEAAVAAEAATAAGSDAAWTATINANEAALSGIGQSAAASDASWQALANSNQAAAYSGIGEPIAGSTAIGGAQVDSAIVGPQVDSTIGGTQSGTNIGGGSANTSIGGGSSGTGYTPWESDFPTSGSSPGGGQASSDFFSDLMNRGRGMMTGISDNKMASSMGGQAILGYANGKNQEALLAARRQEADRARANARFGGVGSRYNAGGMMNAGNLTYKG